jgi:Tol biopolymer transport system component
MLVKNEKHRVSRPVLSPILLIAAFTLFTIQLPTAHGQNYSDWSAPVSLGPVINASASDQGPAISKDGLSLYFHSNRPGGLGGFDMYVSQRASDADPWGSPMNLGPTVNTTFDEGNPAFSRDGHLLFFQSTRPGGLGGIDLWVSSRSHTHEEFNWEPAVNLGSGVNSSADENAPTYFDNDEQNVVQLYFVSNRLGGLGGQDIYLSNQMPDGSFGPAALVFELSSSSTDSRPSIRHDGREIFFQSNRAGSLSTALDLWVATRESAVDTWSTPVNLGSTVNTTSIDNNANLSSDRMTLFFSSDRPGGLGGLDLYMTTRERLRGQ